MSGLVVLGFFALVFTVLNIYCLYKGLVSLLGGGDPLATISWLMGSVALGINTKFEYKRNK